jgi:hypothetical protein
MDNKGYIHIFYTENPIMQEMGLARYTLSDLREYCESYNKSAQEGHYITINSDGTHCTSGELYDAMVGKNIGTNDPVPDLFAWNPEEKNFKYRKLSEYRFADNLSTFYNMSTIERAIALHRIYLKEKYKPELDTEDYYVNISPVNHTLNTKFVNQIVTSQSGCINHHPKLYYVSRDSNATPYEFKPKVCLYIRDPQSKTELKNTIALKSPIVSDIPKTRGGTNWGYSITKTFSHKDNFGSIRKPVNDSDNLDNKVAGYLDTSYNFNTKKFEAGTKQILVRLLEDISPVVSPGVDVVNISNSTHEDFYSPEGDQNQLGDWDEEAHTGSGLVLYLHNSNKNLFGPLFVNRENEGHEKELVLITNRSSVQFLTNDLVLASEIDGEWIPMKLAGGQSVSSVKVENWSFTKMIADSDSYFRDERYHERLSQGQAIPENYVQNQVDSESYRQKMRNKFYKEMAIDYPISGDIAKLNFDPLDDIKSRTDLQNLSAKMNAFLVDRSLWDIQPSQRYLQITAFDQMGHFAGGKNVSNLIGRFNFDSPPDSVPDDQWDINGLKFLGTWGPSFIDGYKSASVQSLLAKKNNMKIRSIGGDGTESLDFFFLPGQTGFDTAASFPAIVDTGVFSPSRNVSLLYSDKGLFYDQADKIAKQLPAEVATNTSPVAKSINSPIEDLRKQRDHWNQSTYTNMIKGTDNIFEVNPIHGKQKRFHWLYIDDGKPSGMIDNPTYNLPPNNPNRIDFFSLSAEMVSSIDALPSGASRDYGNATMMNVHLRNPTYPKHLLGDDFIFERNSLNGSAADYNRKMIKRGGIVSTGPEIPLIPYDKYVVKRDTASPIGVLFLPDIWEEDSADAVGIISSRCKIKLKGSNQLRFLLNQQFGLPARKQTRVLAGLDLGSFFGGGYIAGSNSFDVDPRWGDLNDRPQDFGTTCLHVKIYDEWPAEQTIYDPRYFAVFHFNPGRNLDPVEQDDEEVTTPNHQPYYPDKITTTVDFRIPTDLDNKIIDDGTPIYHYSEVADPQKWRVDPIRRGKMLTNGGFKYFKKVIGIQKSDIWRTSPGKGYVVGDILRATGGPKNVQVVVTAIISSSDPELNGGISDFEVLDKGQGVLPEQLGTGSTSTRTPQTESKVLLVGGTGTGAVLVARSGIVYDRVELDAGPQERVPITRLTDPSNRGLGNNDDGNVVGIKEKVLIIQEPNENGKYDLFFHYHNDITHTIHSGSSFFRCYVQRVLMEISAV